MLKTHPLKFTTYGNSGGSKRAQELFERHITQQREIAERKREQAAREIIHSLLGTTVISVGYSIYADNWTLFYDQEGNLLNQH